MRFYVFIRVGVAGMGGDDAVGVLFFKLEVESTIDVGNDFFKWMFKRVD